MAAFWTAVGKGLAKVAVYSAKGAIWASQHPEVIKIVGSIAVAHTSLDPTMVNRVEAGVVDVGDVLANTQIK